MERFGDDAMELNDRYQVPLDEYRDIQLVVRCDDRMCELQLDTEPVMRATRVLFSIPRLSSHFSEVGIDM